MAEEDTLDDIFKAVGYGRWQLPVLAVTLLVHAVLPVHMIGSTLLSAPMSFRCLSASSSAEDAIFLRVFTESAATNNETIVFPALSEAGVVYDNQCHPDTLTSPLPVPTLTNPLPVPTLTSPLSVLTLTSTLPVPTLTIPLPVATLTSTLPVPTVTSPLPPPASLHHLRTTTLLSCPQVEYDTSIFYETIISEFNLICERTTLRPLYQMLYSIGAMIGGPTGGLFSDSGSVWRSRGETPAVSSVPVRKLRSSMRFTTFNL